MEHGERQRAAGRGQRAERTRHPFDRLRASRQQALGTGGRHGDAETRRRGERIEDRRN